MVLRNTFYGGTCKFTSLMDGSFICELRHRAGISCFICLKNNSKILFIYIGIAVLLMTITLSGIFK